MSKDLGSWLIFGFIRSLNDNKNVILTANIIGLCIEYWYIHIPRCSSWISGWLSQHGNNNRNKFPIDIDYDTGFVTVKRREPGYLDEFMKKMTNNINPEYEYQV